MDKQQSDHIENRFRQAADNFLPPQNEEAWKRMEALLDKDPDRRKPFIWWWMLALLLVGAGGAGTYYYVHNRPEKKETTVQLQTGRALSGAHVNKANRPGPVTTNISKDQPANNSDDKETSGKQKEELVILTDTQTARKTFSVNHKDAPVSKPAPKRGRQTGAYISVSNRSAGKGDATKRNKKERTETAVLQNSAEAADLATAEISSSYQQPAYLIEVNIPDSILKYQDGQLVLQDSLQTAINEAIRKAAQQDLKPAKFYFIVAAGRNATNLRKFDTANVGTVFGGEIGYHLNSTFSIQAGIHAGKKIYSAGLEDYKGKPGSRWRDPTVRIKKVDADCYILDFPLSVRADLLHNRHHALFATAGLSSFVTTREEYHYHYNYGTMYRYDSGVYKGNVDWFTSAYFSIGFEQRVFKTFYLQAEPYAKLPLSGIGEGKVKLYSLGIQLGLKYQPLKRK